MTAPRVSVIIPTFERFEMLREAIASVQAQTMADLDCLVADDGSHDQTIERVRVVTKQDPRVRLISLPHSGMPGRTRNGGLKEARGRWVAFLDDDDLWLPHKLERQLAHADSQPDAVLVCSRIREFGASSELWPTGDVPKQLSSGLLARGNLIATSTVLARREALNHAGGFDADLPRAQDYDLWLRVARCGEVHFIDEVLCNYRMHSANISGNRTLAIDCLEKVIRRAHAAGDLTIEQLRGRLGDLHHERAQQSTGIRHWQWRLKALASKAWPI